MSLTQFLTAQITEYHRPNLFSVYFNPNFNSLNKINYSSVLVRTSQIPGQTINTIDTTFNNKKQNFAKNIDLDPITMTVFCDVGNSAHSFLLEWQSKVISPGTRIMNYKQEYVGSVDIGIHDRPLVIAGIESVTATLVNAFPINVGPIELSHDSENEICSFSVSFIFDDVEYEFANGFTSSLLSFGVGVAGITGLL